MQFWPVLSLLGSRLRNGSRLVEADDYASHRATGQRRIVKGAGILAAGLCASAGFATSASANEVEITITDLRSDKGVVRACMTTKEKIFPKCRKDPESYRTVVPAGKTVTIRFKDVKPGDYAIALLHDENDNGKADRALGMMPKEGYGFSRDAPVRMAPPKFKDAVFEIGSDPKQLTIKMRYFL